MKFMGKRTDMSKDEMIANLEDKVINLEKELHSLRKYKENVERISNEHFININEILDK